MILSDRTRANLRAVRPELVAVLCTAIHGYERFRRNSVVVVSGYRSLEEQAKLYPASDDRRITSRHLTGHAADVAILRKGVLLTDIQEYAIFAGYVKAAAENLEVKVTWGGDWPSVDGPHFQLDR